jgi:hypothetical protein
MLQSPGACPQEYCMILRQLVSTSGLGLIFESHQGDYLMIIAISTITSSNI